MVTFHQIIECISEYFEYGLVRVFLRLDTSDLHEEYLQKCWNVLPEVELNFDFSVSVKEVVATDLVAFVGVKQPSIGNRVEFKHEDERQTVHHQIINVSTPVHQDDHNQDFGRGESDPQDGECDA